MSRSASATLARNAAAARSSGACSTWSSWSSSWTARTRRDPGGGRFRVSRNAEVRALLREPGGFEGFLPRRIVLHGHRHSVTQRVDGGDVLVQLEPGAFAAAGIAGHDEDGFAEVLEGQRLRAELVEPLEQVLCEEPLHPFSSVQRLHSEDRTNGRPPLHVGV